ncbi:MAG: redox-regulated ATPase YchF [Nanoarchaeota archaeon]|nr:redox-regulated ATPase YchF [Nanoarchaeota archaeon]
MLIGVVGKANVGKSTFFRAATLAPAEIGPYPFVTIKPNRAIAYVKVKCPACEKGLKCNPGNSPCIDGFRFVPFELIDVAGLIPGAHEGLGLGNQFLDDLRQADALIHVVDAAGATDEKGNPIPPGSRNPKEDIVFLNEEIDFWIQNILIKHFRTKHNQKISLNEIAEKLSGLKITKEQIQKATKELNYDLSKIREWSDEQFLEFAIALRVKSKPILIAANKCDIPIARENTEKLKKEFPEYNTIPTSAESELVLREANEKKIIHYIPGESEFKIIGNPNEKQKQALEFVRNHVLKTIGNTGVQQALNSVVFNLLNYIAVFPVEDENKLTDGKGRILPDAYLLPKGATALDLAYKIHSDIGDNFIGAIDCKTKRKIGKDTELKNGDIIKILTRR